MYAIGRRFRKSRGYTQPDNRAQFQLAKPCCVGLHEKLKPPPPVWQADAADLGAVSRMQRQTRFETHPRARGDYRPSGLVCYNLERYL
ncbi:MAG: hypothetical protein D6775_12755 [Caldilineae bacterium]|nr:MAG: hypothetical protein D6775_12755 [Caldilineae bacterium]